MSVREPEWVGVGVEVREKEALPEPSPCIIGAPPVGVEEKHPVTVPLVVMVELGVGVALAPPPTLSPLEGEGEMEVEKQGEALWDREGV